MNNKLEEAKNEMFANVEDPQNSRWWEVAWETLHNEEFGSAISKDATVVEKALWLLELRNIHATYEAVFYGWQYEPIWMEWWEFTGLSKKELTKFLKTEGALDADEEKSLSSAVHAYCWGKRQQVFDILLSKFVDETELFMFFLGGKIPRNRDRAQAICDWVDEAFEY